LEKEKKIKEGILAKPHARRGGLPVTGERRKNAGASRPENNV
jgi:hypothetical protein